MPFNVNVNTVKKTIGYFCEKPDVKFPVNLNFKPENFLITFENKTSEAVRADLGSIAIMLKDKFCQEMGNVDYLAKNIASRAGVENYSIRAKSAGSIYKKLVKCAKKGVVKDYDSAIACITDGKGSRFNLSSLCKLNRSSINRMINELRIEGKELTLQEKGLLSRYIYFEDNMSPEEIKKAFPIFEKFANPLIEEHSKPVFEEVMLSIVKQRMVKEGLTISQIREQGLLPEELIHALETKNIIPKDYEILNNYRGENGIPIFTNRQVQMMRKASGGKLIVHSRPDLLEYSKHPHANASNVELGIKETGYQGAQFKLKDNYEEQYRGVFASEGAEIEHSSYDSISEKFVSELNKAHKMAFDKLTDTEKMIYNSYKERYYNAWARKDLGLPYRFPKLPTGFDEVLSMQSIEKLHKSNIKFEKKAANGFIPHFTEVA